MNNLFVGSWHKVSFEKFKEDFNKIYNQKVSDSIIKKVYDNIKIPKRGTPGSAGYDMFAPFSFKLRLGDSILIPSGISATIEPGKWIMIVPRSGTGSKYKIEITCTMGVIDSDYCDERNPTETGQMFIKLTYSGCYSVIPDFNNVIINDNMNVLVDDKSIVCLESPSIIEFNTGDAICQAIIVDHYLMKNEFWEGMPDKSRHSGGGIIREHSK